MNHVNGTTTPTGTRPWVARVQQLRGFAKLCATIERAAERVKADIDRLPAAGASSGSQRVHVTGLRGSSSVFLLEAVRQRLDRPVVVVCPDQEAAEDTLSDLRTISDARAVLFPERDVFPHPFELHENLGVRGDRNDALLAILGGDVDVVVTSLLGFIEKTRPPNALMSQKISIRVGDALDLESFRARLVQGGYDSAPVVEEAGQFAVRGSIVDLFDASWDLPVRLELSDDEVLSIRTFDLDSQRSIEKRESVTVLPVASVPYDPAAFARLRRYLEETGFDTAAVDRIEEEIAHGGRSDLCRRYAPVLGANGSLIDYFAVAPLVWFQQTEAQPEAFRRLEKDLADATARTEAAFPLLALDQYLHPCDYHLGRAAATVHLWGLTAVAEEVERWEPFEPIRADETVVQFHTHPHPSVLGKMETLVEQIRKLHRRHVAVHIYSETPTQRERLADMLEEAEALVHLPVGWIASGFVWDEAGLAVLTDHEIFNRILPRPRRKTKKRRVQGIRHEHLQVGDFVVHVDYGIGRFVGLEKIGSDEDQTECLTVRYLRGDRIFVPLDQMHLVEKYIGKEGVAPRVDHLGGTRWQKTKERARAAIEDIARELLEVYAVREVANGHAFSPDNQWQRELEASFPYEETPHQLRATEEIKSDMQSDRPMDRLVCGDVGFGKTEVAIRAAFKAAADGKQVAVLVPTTLLAFQHYSTFKERLAGFPIAVRMLSRFVPKPEQKLVVEGLKNGTVDVVVGTHRLLSKDVGFKDLGLVIVDEEHRFGVKHKERLKRLIKEVDVLSLTATPIPRTLYMSLSGLREISIIDTPPRNRHPVKTEVVPFDEDLLQRVIGEEIGRNGQVFFVHNRVQSIQSMRAFLERLLPGVRFGVAHGQMSERELERVVLDFMDRQYDVLVTTMIIESGLDMPGVNTIVINRADRFGLAQLYQLRGRVGRREQQAYAYFLVPRQLSITEGASKRLQAMEEFEELGSGYRLAMRDLEIRGAGNVLGIQQHGHVAAVGFDMYCKMLKEAVDNVRSGEKPAAPAVPQCRIESPYSYYLPEDYVEDADERMMIYKRLAGADTLEQLGALESELVDRFGELPGPARTLLDLAAVKLLAGAQGIALARFKLNRSARERADRARALGRALSGIERFQRSAGAGALGTGGEDSGAVEFEFAPDRALSREQCTRLVETFERRLLFKSGKTFGLRMEVEPSDRLLLEAKNLLQVALFSNKV